MIHKYEKLKYTLISGMNDSWSDSLRKQRKTKPSNSKKRQSFLTLKQEKFANQFFNSNNNI